MENYEHPFWRRLYDLIHSGDAADVAFYLREAQMAKGPVLEVACGTGRILLPMIQRGIEAWGIDISQSMLLRLQEKAHQLGLVPNIVRADMRRFSLPQQFPLIIVPFRSFLHLSTQADQIAALSCIREHLLPRGRLILNIYAPGSRDLIEHEGGLRLVKDFTDPFGGRPMKAWQAIKNDTVNQRQTIEWVLHELDEGGNIVLTRSLSVYLRWIYKSEFELLLRAAGYSGWKVFGGFNGEVLQREDQEMVWIAYA